MTRERESEKARAPGKRLGSPLASEVLDPTTEGDGVVAAPPPIARPGATGGAGERSDRVEVSAGSRSAAGLRHAVLLVPARPGELDSESHLVALRSAVEPLGWTVEEPRPGRRGRPLAADAPDPATVRSLRAEGRTWGQIVRRLGCTRSAAQRAARRSPEKGVLASVALSVEGGGRE